MRPGAALLLSHPKAHLLALASGAMLGRTSLLQVYDAAVSDNRIDRLSARLPVRRVAISQHTADVYDAVVRRHPSQTTDGVAVVRPAVDLAAVAERAVRGDADGAMAVAGLVPGRLDLVMVARLQTFKGPHAFLRLAAEVAARDPSSRSLLIGPDAAGEPGLRQELQDAIRGAGLEGRVALAGYVSGDDLAALVARSCALVHPADRETFGLVLVEAMTLGTPVIAYASEGPDEVLREGGGVLVPNGDEVALSMAAARVLANGEYRAGLGQAARSAARRFDVSSLGPAYEALLFPGTAQ